jgi:hypothetical protein
VILGRKRNEIEVNLLSSENLDGTEERNDRKAV